jgi:D-alanyl-D-alanine carboxypeptidase/D-alanyl-D-alanine-endopeptidase (penicillin-binding protein 4)
MFTSKMPNVKNIPYCHHLLVMIFLFSCSKAPTLINVKGHKKALDKITTIIQESGLQTNIGIKIVELESNEIIYEWNTKALFNPASNIKLYTCIAALAMLDTNQTFSTSVYQDTTAVYLVGGGDPHLTLNQLDTMAQTISDTIKLHLGQDYWFLNNRIRMRTIDRAKKINYLVLDDSMLDDVPYGPGWMWDEGSWWYAAQISALSVNENCVDFYVTPGIKQHPVLIKTNPATRYISITNQSITVDDTTDFNKLKITRDWKKLTNSFTITGNVLDTASTDTFQRNVHDPTLYSGTVFAEMLQSRGINIKHIIKGTLPAGTMKVAEHRSKPVQHALTEFMKRSENLTAELLVKHIGAVVYDTVGTWNNGLLAIKTFLHDTVGIDTNTFRLSDGSGVSRYNYSSPDHFIKLLTWAYNNKPVRDKFLNTFPIGGWDGTLEDRMQNEESLAKIIAKTGTLSGVSCLSGYIFTTRGDPLAFSILMNGYVDEAKPFRSLQDKIVTALTEIKL